MALFGEVGVALVKPFGRSIAGLIPDVVIEEGHSDRLISTDHPVEQGGVVSDHAFKAPPTLEIRAGWSDSSAGEAGYSRATYEAFLRIQNSKQLVTVYTGKRAYRNLLPDGITAITDQRTENSAILVLTFKQLTLTRIQTAGTPDAYNPDPAAQADPSNTGTVTDSGPVDGVPTSQSDLGYQLGGSSDFSVQPDTAAADTAGMPGIAQPDPITLPTIETPPDVTFTGPGDISELGNPQIYSPNLYNMFGT